MLQNYLKYLLILQANLKHYNNQNHLLVKRANLLSAVDRVSTIANEKSPVIKFKLLNNLVNLSTVNNENSTATEDLKVTYDGDEIEIGFNSKYIMDILNNLEECILFLLFKYLLETKQVMPLLIKAGILGITLIN